MAAKIQLGKRVEVARNVTITQTAELGDAESYGFILCQTPDGWVKSGQAAPLELYTPDIISRHLEAVTLTHGPVSAHIVVTAADLELMDEEGLQQHYRGETRLHWQWLGPVIPFGLPDAEPVQGLLRRTALSMGLTA